MNIKIAKTLSREIVAEGNATTVLKQLFTKKNDGVSMKIITDAKTIYLTYNNTFTALNFSIWLNDNPTIIAKYEIYQRRFELLTTVSAHDIVIIAMVVAACEASLKKDGV